MKEQLISFKTAKLAKEKGFNEGSMSHYEEDGQIQYCRTSFTNGFVEDGEIRFEAPTQSLLQKWLRETHDIIVFIAPLIPDCKEFGVTIYSNKYKNETDVTFFNNYEEALEKGLYQALLLL